jgi:hypothetical protein
MAVPSHEPSHPCVRSDGHPIADVGAVDKPSTRPDTTVVANPDAVLHDAALSDLDALVHDHVVEEETTFANDDRASRNGWSKSGSQACLLRVPERAVFSDDGGFKYIERPKQRTDVTAGEHVG